jgi:hypothetical protein
MFKKLFYFVEKRVIKSKIEKIIDSCPADQFVSTVRVLAQANIDLFCDAFARVAIGMVKANKETISELVYQIKTYIDSPACQELVKNYKDAVASNKKFEEEVTNSLDIAIKAYKEKVAAELQP